MRTEKGIVMAELRGYALKAGRIRLLFGFFVLALMGCAVSEAPPSSSPIPPSPIRGHRDSSPLSPAIPPSSTPPPETQKFSFIAEDINTNTQVLPSGFVGGDPQSTVEWFKKALFQIPIKIDQYSTAAERAQFDQLLTQQFSSLGLLPFTVLESFGQCHKRYNPEAQQFSFALSPSPYPSSLQPHKLSRSRLYIFNEQKNLGSYEASNAFGVTTIVSRYSTKEITLAVPPVSSNVLELLRDEEYFLSKRKYYFSVQMASAEARESDKDIRCLALFRPYYPYVFDYSYRISPTINLPLSSSTTGTALLGRLEQLWVFNQRSGTIYTKIK
jgi:hypothetical protein